MKNNQIRAVGLIIDHIVNHQNHFVSGYMFRDNLLKLLERGIDINRLLASQVFVWEFEFEEWPQVHTDKERMTRPYNGSMFDLRRGYKDIFPELAAEEDPGEDDDAEGNVYKITYTLNLLPAINQPEGSESLMSLLSGMSSEEEMQIFTS